jgi:branched-chain amino acid transport system ATP-binding protein/urea transport system ATP-binding protein
VADLLLLAEGLTKRFGGLTAVSDVSLKVEPKALLCLIGPNGAGKSTLLNMLTGTLEPSSGTILFDGSPTVGLPLYRVARLGISRKFQVPSIFDSLTVAECIEVAQLNPGPQRPVPVEDVLALVELAPFADRPALALAHGQKQWLEIGIALAVNPKLLLLDEPTAGMTPSETLRTADLVSSLSGHCAIIVVEHDMRFVRALNSNVVVLHQGTILASGTFEQIQRDERVRDVYLGRA